MEREASPNLLDFFCELSQDGDVYADDLLAFDGDTDHNLVAVQDSLGGPCIGADTSATPLAAVFSPLDRQPSTVSTSTALQPAPSWPDAVASPTPGDSLQRLVMNQAVPAAAAAAGPVRRSRRGRASRQRAAPSTPVPPSPALAASQASTPRLLPPAAVPASSLLAPPALLPGLQGEHPRSHATGGPVDGGVLNGLGAPPAPCACPGCGLWPCSKPSTAHAQGPQRQQQPAVCCCTQCQPLPAPSTCQHSAARHCMGASCSRRAVLCRGRRGAFGAPGNRRPWWHQHGAQLPAAPTPPPPCNAPAFGSRSPDASPGVGPLGSADATGGAGMATAPPSSLGSSYSRKRCTALASPAAGGCWGDGDASEVAVGGSSPVLLAQQIMGLEAAHADLQHTLSCLYVGWAAAQEPASQPQHSAAQGSRSAAAPGVAEQAVAAHEEDLLHQVMCLAASTAAGGGGGGASFVFLRGVSV